MDYFLVFLYIAYLVGLGQAWLVLLARPSAWRWTQLAWVFGIGAVVWGYGQFLLNVFDISTHGMRLYVWQAVFAALPYVLSKRIPSPLAGEGRRGRDEGGPSPSGRNGHALSHMGRGILGLFIAIAALTVILQALTLPMHMWDSIVIYGFKAKILFQEQTFKTSAFFDHEVLHYSADYPLLVPYLEAGLYRWLGHPDDRLVRILFAVFWAAWLGIIYEALAKRIRQDLAGLLVAIIATLPLFSTVFMGQAASGFADIPFALYWTALLVCPRSLLPLIAVGCVFTKSEGVPLAVIGLGLRREYRMAAASLLILAPWVWVRHLLPHNSAHYARALSLPAGELFGRLRLIFFSCVHELLEVRRWGIYWFLAFAGVLWPVRSLSLSKESKRLLIAVGLQGAVYLYVYLTYTQDLSLLLPVTLLRLMIHLIGPLTVAVGWRLI